MSNDQVAVTVVLSTHNRSTLLKPAIQRLLLQSAATPAYEIVIVDNNSSDDTRSVVEDCARTAPVPLKYVFEKRQGLSYGRNAGIAAARASVVAFTDDDVRVADDWVKAIHQAFVDHPDVECLGGRILPVWPTDPPGWLTKLHWVGPLALQDYGPAPFVVDRQRPVCLAGANFAFRKNVFDRIGLFSPEFPRSEDTELMLRLWLSGARALYVPDMVAYAAVQAERLTKGYHRQWYTNIGRCNARMAFGELTAGDGSLRTRVPEFSRLLGVPLFALRQLTGEGIRWIIEMARRDESKEFWHESRIRTLIGYIRESAALYRRRVRTHPAARGRAVAVADRPAASPVSTHLRS